MRPQLCNSIDQATLLKLLEDPEWGVQQKVDGHRCLVSLKDGYVAATARNGQPMAIGKSIVFQLSTTMPTGSYVLDGELIDGRLVLFDLVRAGDFINPKTPFGLRYEGLRNLADIAGWEGSKIEYLRLATTHQEKVALVASLITAQAEGVVCRKLSGAYLEGPRRSNLTVKFKFIKEVDCHVTDRGVNGKNNFVLTLYDADGAPQEVGHVTALAGDKGAIEVGDVVTVQYLYASKDGRLIQPTVPRKRTDKDPGECSMDQLIFTNKEVFRC